MPSTDMRRIVAERLQQWGQRPKASSLNEPVRHDG